jgi:hypothetical protein
MACGRPPTVARPGSTWDSTRPCRSAASCSIRGIPITCSWRWRETCSYPAWIAVSIDRRTAGDLGPGAVRVEHGQSDRSGDRSGRSQPRVRGDLRFNSCCSYSRAG